MPDITAALITQEHNDARDAVMLLELAWTNPNPPTPTERRVIRDTTTSDTTAERRYLAYWGTSIFFTVRCVVYELIAGKHQAA